MKTNGNPFESLPFPTTVPFSPFPTNLPNAPFSIEQYAPVDANTPDLVHRFYQEQSQINHGKRNRFAVVSDAKGLVMGYYHTAHLPLAEEAPLGTRAAEQPRCKGQRFDRGLRL